MKKQMHPAMIKQQQIMKRAAWYAKEYPGKYSHKRTWEMAKEDIEMHDPTIYSKTNCAPCGKKNPGAKWHERAQAAANKNMEQFQTEFDHQYWEGRKDAELYAYSASKTLKINPPSMYLGIYKDDSSIGTIITDSGRPTKRQYPMFTQMVGPFTSLRELGSYAMNMQIHIDNPPRDWHQKQASNPAKMPIKIYDQIESIEAIKGSDSLWSKQPFRHSFKGKTKAAIFGNPDGSLTIKGKKPLWKQFNYPEKTRKSNPISRQALNQAQEDLKTMTHDWDIYIAEEENLDDMRQQFIDLLAVLSQAGLKTTNKYPDGVRIVEFKKNHPALSLAKAAGSWALGKVMKNAAPASTGRRSKIKVGSNQRTNKPKRRPNLAMIAGAIRSPKTPIHLKEGLMRKYKKELTAAGVI